MLVITVSTLLPVTAYVVNPGGSFFLPILLLLEGFSNVYKNKIHTALSFGGP